MAIAHRFTLPDKYYACTVEDYGFQPGNSTYETLPDMPWDGVWPQWTGDAWDLVPDYRERREPEFAPDLCQSATEYWLPGDAWDTPARHMTEIGPLPDGALLARPEKTPAERLTDAQAARRQEILAGYDAAVAASLTMPQDSPTQQDVTVGAAAFAAEDPEGLAYIMQTHAARRDELLAALEAAETAEAALALDVSYAV